MKSDARFVFELAATYADKYTPIYRASAIRRFPAQAAELRELFDLTEWVMRFFQRQHDGPNPTFRANLKAQLLAEFTQRDVQRADTPAVVLSDLGWEWDLPRPDRRWTAVGIGSAVAVAGVIAAYWRNREAPPAA